MEELQALRDRVVPEPEAGVSGDQVGVVGDKPMSAARGVAEGGGVLELLEGVAGRGVLGRSPGGYAFVPGGAGLAAAGGVASQCVELCCGLSQGLASAGCVGRQSPGQCVLGAQRCARQLEQGPGECGFERLVQRGGQPPVQSGAALRLDRGVVVDRELQFRAQAGPQPVGVIGLHGGTKMSELVHDRLQLSIVEPGPSLGQADRDGSQRMCPADHGDLLLPAATAE
ncbi:hypothetical protein ACFV9C_42630 [Kribbella sp. NPDC059898]|uniref:hypothetical protein n=1 Tax=Kribbella sp. NPDC059898 TaxID=3346995 RepID=UPI00365ECCF1